MYKLFVLDRNTFFLFFIGYGYAHVPLLCFPLVTVPVHGGARGVMVIVVGNGHDDTISNPGRD